MTVGWRYGVFISGAIIILIIGPLSLLLRDNPESMGLLPDGDRPEDRAAGPQSGTRPPGSAARRRRARLQDTDFTAKGSDAYPNLLADHHVGGVSQHRPLGYFLPPGAGDGMVPARRRPGAPRTQSLPIAALLRNERCPWGPSCFNPTGRLRLETA